MTGYGVTPDGFSAKTLETILGEMSADWRSEFEESADLDPQTPDGQTVGIFAERFAEVWQALQATYAAFDPDQAEGAALDALCALVGVFRLAAAPSTVTLTLTGTNGTTIATGKQASVADTGTKFATLADAILATATAWQTSHNYTAIGTIVRNGTTQRIFELITPGMSAASGGPTTTAADITDNSAHWRYIGDGSAYATVAAESVEDGPLVALSGTITTIENPVAGWQGVTNTLDADLGRNEETDTELRVRREEEIRKGGNASAEAIRAHVQEVSGVTSAEVPENDTDATDGDGLPPHSFQVLVLGGTDATVAQTIWTSKAAGIQTFGTSSAVVTDAAGNPKTIYFTRPTDKNVYVAITVDVDNSPGSLWPSDGADQVAALIATYGDTFRIAMDVRSSAIGAQAVYNSVDKSGVPGVLGFSVCNIGFAPSPGSSATLTIGATELAKFDTSRVAVTVNLVTP